MELMSYWRTIIQADPRPASELILISSVVCFVRIMIKLGAYQPYMSKLEMILR